MLLDSYNIASKSLNAASLAIQVAGQNMSNSENAGYVREQVILGTSYPKTNANGITTGTGVDTIGVTQMIDLYLEERLRNSQSDAMNTSTQVGVYEQLEFIISELSDSDISSLFDSFFNSIADVLNQPEDIQIRQIAIDEGVKLANLFNVTSQSILNTRVDINKSVVQLCDQINLLTAEIASLNQSIASIEAGQSPGVEAVGLRDQRLVALSNLSQLINIKTHEDDNGVVTVYCGNDILVADSGAKKLTVGYNTDPYGDLSLAEIRYASNNEPLDLRSGKLLGLYEGRDTILGEFSQSLDEFAAVLVSTFNGIYASGQGLTGYDKLTGTVNVQETDVPLDQLGLFPEPKNGTFSIIVQDKETGVSSTMEISVPLTGSASQHMTLESLVESLNQVDGITAKIDNSNRLQITASNSGVQFAFVDDTSGILSSLGVNTFFTGSSARDIGVNDVIRNDPGKFALSNGGIGADVDNGVLLAAIPELKIADIGNKSLTEAYQIKVVDVMSQGGVTKAVATGQVAYYSSLQAQRDSISGVNIDEETLYVFAAQRVYQATSRYVTTINEMFDALLNM